VLRSAAVIQLDRKAQSKEFLGCRRKELAVPDCGGTLGHPVENRHGDEGLG
jgi:hypothetical protein